ncbi:OmpH family outer membrane protein [Flavobacteriales bacterium]|jgi:outer membrane protein|nr:OmpH family outer membrane protein [Flavobacteriales bacterium]
MKKAGAITNIILMIAVAILFFLHFDSEKQGLKREEQAKEEKEEVNLVEPSEALVSGAKGMYYIDQDSLYQISTVLKKLIEKNQTKILGLETQYQKAMNDFQVYDNQMATKVQTANAFERSQLENEYKRKAYDLSLLEQDTQKKLLNIQTTFTQSLKSKIIAGINQLNSEGQFTYVLMSSSTIDIVLPVDTSLNITKQVASVIDKK